MKNNQGSMQHCAICGKKVNPATAKDVELSNTDDKYYAKGIPVDHESLGWFPVGSDCFKREVVK